MDADALFAGAASVSGASHVILQLGELGIVEVGVPDQARIEAERNLRVKLPAALPAFRTLVDACTTPLEWLRFELRTGWPVLKRPTRKMRRSWRLPLRAAAAGSSHSMSATIGPISSALPCLAHSSRSCARCWSATGSHYGDGEGSAATASRNSW